MNESLCLLGPAWYFSAPGLAWDATLKITKIRLELLSDLDMLLMIDSGIRGGIATISHRNAKANNEYMGTEFDPVEEFKFISYLDANNLYGWAMSKQLPTSGFKWMTDNGLDDWKHLSCFLEVDLEYPEYLHSLHNDYPLAPERIKRRNVEKLIPNLNNKTNYFVRYEHLKLYESLGLKITNRGIKFEVNAWLKEYINSVSGKTLENIINRIDIRLITSDKVAQKLAPKPIYDCCTTFDKTLIAVHMQKTKLYFNKPVYLGMSILDLSKSLMYDFHYNYIKTKYFDKAKLPFTDTDSLAYEITTKEFYKYINPNIEKRFDTGDYPTNHPSGMKTGLNSEVLGMLKDEAGGKQIVEFVGLRAKLHSYKMLDGSEYKKCKGVTKNVMERSIQFDDYRECLFSRKEQHRKMNVIRSHCH